MGFPRDFEATLLVKHVYDRESAKLENVLHYLCAFDISTVDGFFTAPHKKKNILTYNLEIKNPIFTYYIQYKS